MATPSFARTERAALCDLFAAVGPDQPTLCAGWRTGDLAAHLVTRERRPDAALGIALRPLAGHTDRVRRRLARRPFDEVLAQLRHPPLWTFSGVPALDGLVNPAEFFIHHEDVRRAQPGWQPRPLAHGPARVLWSQARPSARLALRRFPGRVELVADGYGALALGSAGPTVRVAGDPGELSIFLSGRQPYARVGLTGDAELVERIGRPGFGH
jgi:uncharacterized protein (TIGR03085 family)